MPKRVYGSKIGNEMHFMSSLSDIHRQFLPTLLYFVLILQPRSQALSSMPNRIEERAWEWGCLFCYLVLLCMLPYFIFCNMICISCSFLLIIKSIWLVYILSPIVLLYSLAYSTHDFPQPPLPIPDARPSLVTSNSLISPTFWVDSLIHLLFPIRYSHRLRFEAV